MLHSESALGASWCIYVCVGVPACVHVHAHVSLSLFVSVCVTCVGACKIYTCVCGDGVGGGAGYCNGR